MTTEVRPVPATVPARQRTVLAHAARVQRRFPIVQIVALVAAYLCGVVTIDGFGSRASLYAMLVLAALLGLAACGQTLVLLIGGIDFSVPAFIVAGATLTVQLTSKYHWPAAAVFILLAVAAVLVGGTSGYLAHRFSVQPLIITLGVGSVVAGAVLVWGRGFVTGSAPTWLTEFSSPASTFFGLPVPPLAVLWLVVALGVGLVLHRTVVGRWIYATGANPRAAELALVPTRRLWACVFGFSALTAVLVGVLLAGFAGSGDSSIGDPYLWQGLTAVVVGGTAFGARGDYWRTVLGALLVTVLGTLLVGYGATPADQQILSGVLILVVVALYGRERRLRDRL